MPELMGLDDEEADITDQGARDRDTQKKQANEDYVDKKFHEREQDVREGDWVLLGQKGQNKVSSSYEKEPYEVMARYGDQVVLRSSNGEEYRRNMLQTKAFNIPDHEWAASQSELGFASATAGYGTNAGDTYYNNSTSRNSKDVFTTRSSGNTP